MLTQGWGRCRVLWEWAFTRFGSSAGMAALGVSALLECRMVKFPLQTSAFLWPKHQGVYIQHFLPQLIQPGQTALQCFQHPCSTASWYPSGNLVFPLVSLVILLFKPSLLCVLDMNRHSRSEAKHAQLNMASPATASNKSLDKGVKSRTSLLQKLLCYPLTASDLPKQPVHIVLTGLCVVTACRNDHTANYPAYLPTGFLQARTRLVTEQHNKVQWDIV